MSDDEHSENQVTAQPAFEILLRAFGECLQQGRFDSAREILAGAQAQADTEKRREQVEGLGALLAERQAQREAGVAAAVAAVERALEAGERMTADRLLFQAGEEHGEHPELSRLHRRIEVAHRQDFEADVRRLIEQADELSQAGGDSDAHELLLKAKALAPSKDAETQGLLAEVAQRIARRTEIHRGERIAIARQQITDRLVALDYPGARAVLQTLVGSLGSSEGLRELQEHLVGTRQEVLGDRVRQAGLAFEQGRFGEACLHLRAALVLSPEDPWIQRRLAEAERRQHEKEQQRQEDPEWCALLAKIEAQRTAGELGAAERSLELAEERWGVGRILDEEREHLKLARLERLAELLRAARKARSEGRMEIARGEVEKALELAPDDGEALHLAELIDRASEPEDLPEAPPELLAEVAEIENLRSGGATLLAWKSVQAAIEAHGEREPLATLRRLIADEMLGGDGL